MEIPILQDIIIILGLAVLINLLFQRIRIPAVMGFLLTGLISGPHGLNLIEATHEVELLSEIGIIFLLFVIGIEFSLKSLSTIKYTVLWGGLMQVGGTIALVFLSLRFFGFSATEALFMGFLLSLSSTAIVLRMLQESGEITAPHGRLSVAILIFQDLVVVPMMLFTPLLGGDSENMGGTLLIMLLKVIAVVAVVIVLARYVVPVIFQQVVKTKSRELFILMVVVLCFSTAWLTASAGLSLALGAFFAGLVISDSDYSHQATANILPFREIFISFFFVSVGMLLDLEFFIKHIFTIHLLALGVAVLKILVVALAVFILRYPLRTIFITAMSLFQVGEFAFLLASTGMEYELLSETVYQYFLSISIITMGGTPLLMKFASRHATDLVNIRLPKPVRERFRSMAAKGLSPAEKERFRDHLVIIGYGINGENVARTASKANIPYVIIDLDVKAIARAKARSEPIVFGDASDDTILRHVAIQDARVVVVAISDPQATKKIVYQVREFTDTAYLIVRTRYIREIEEIIKLGADEVIPEEFETSIEIFTRVLKKYLVPSHEVEEFVNRIRSGNYDMLRNISQANQISRLTIPDMDIATLSVQQGNNKIVGKTILESQLRSTYGITVLAIKRGDEYITDIDASVEILQDDVLYLFGKPENIARVNKYLRMD